MGIELIDLCFSFGKRAVLHDVSLKVPSGQLGVVLGRNGCGKTTLLRVASGLLKPTSGRILIDGIEADAATGQIGHLAQFHHPMFSFTVRDVILTGRAARISGMPRQEDNDAAEEAMQRLAISHLSSLHYDQLSGGERQLVMIARVLAQGPRAMFLDEPASHLDLANQFRLLSTLRKLVDQGLTVLAVLHDPNQAFLFADTIACMRAGRIVTPAEGQAIASPEFMGALYEVPMKTINIDGVPAVFPLSPARTL